MSIQATYELHTELKRIAIASVTLAKDDFRLKKLIPVLKKSGESVPVFQKVASLTESLISEAENRSAVLLELLNIVIAIISTQGETSVQGERKELEEKAYPIETQITFRKLKPVLDALENSGTGRMAVLKEAEDTGVFKEFRTIRYLIKALEASFPELYNLAYDKLKGFGEIIIDSLKNSMDLMKPVYSGRIITLISDIAKEKENDFYISFLKDESPEEVLISAISSLRHKAENINVVLEYIRHKKKAVRTAAYTTLGSFNNQETTDLFMNAYLNNERDLIKDGFSLFSSDTLLDFIINKTKETLHNLLLSDKFQEAKTKNQKLPYQDKDVSLVIDSLEIISCKKENRVFDFYKEISRNILDLALLENKPKNSLKNAAEVYIDALFSYNTSPSLKLIADFQKASAEFTAYSFIASVFVKRPQDVYEEYSKIIKKNQKDPRAIQVIDLFHDLYNCVKSQRFSLLMKRFSEQQFDIRWADVFIDLDFYQVVLLFVHFKNKSIVPYLMKKTKELVAKKQEPWEIIEALLTISDKHIPDFIIKTIRERLKINPNSFLDFYMLRKLPKDCAAEIEKLGKEFSNQVLLDLANDLQNK